MWAATAFGNVASLTHAASWAGVAAAVAVSAWQRAVTAATWQLCVRTDPSLALEGESSIDDGTRSASVGNGRACGSGGARKRTASVARAPSAAAEANATDGSAESRVTKR
jgi:hypothetical protein